VYINSKSRYNFCEDVYDFYVIEVPVVCILHTNEIVKTGRKESNSIYARFLMTPSRAVPL